MPNTSLSVPELEQVYDVLASAIDEAGEAHTPVFLVKLALLQAQDSGDAKRFQELVKVALRDLKN